MLLQIVVRHMKNRESNLGSKYKEKIVALTFDDGPHPIFTPQILDILAKYNAKATFS